MYRIKVGNKYWDFEQSKITSNSKSYTNSELEAYDIADFLKNVFDNKKIKVEKVND